MLQDVYKVDGKYPDPHEIENRLAALRNDPSLRDDYDKALAEIESSGMSSHPLLGRFFVES